MRGSLVAGLGMLASVVAVAPALAATDPLLIGRAAVVENSVSARDKLRSRVISLNDGMFFRDEVITADKAKTVIEFRDGSTLEIGPHGSMMIDELVFNPVEGKNNKSINLLSGTFRYVSGYVAKDAVVSFRTPMGTVGIRGSSMVSVVDPDPAQPTFVQMSSGTATVTNASGSVNLNQGQATAIPSSTQSPAPPGSMPAPVVAQAIQVVQRVLGASPTRLPPAPPQLAQAINQSNVVPVAAQQSALGAVPPRSPSPVSTAGTTSLPLLAQANRVGLLTQPANAPLTAAQRTFVADAAAANPQAAQMVQSFNQAAQAANAVNQNRSTGQVVNGAATASPQQVQQLVTQAVGANPAAAAVVATAATMAVPGQAQAIAANAVTQAPAAAAQVSAAVTQVVPAAAAQIAGAVTTVVPAQAASIAAAVVQVAPNQAAQVAGAVTTASPTQAAQVAAAAAQVAPAQAVQIASTVATAAPSQVALIGAVVSSIAPQSAGAVLQSMSTALGINVATLQGQIQQAQQQAQAVVAQSAVTVQQAKDEVQKSTDAVQQAQGTLPTDTTDKAGDPAGNDSNTGLTNSSGTIPGPEISK